MPTPATPIHLPQIQTLLNHHILHTNAVYEEQPWTLERTREWFEQRRAQGFPVIVEERDGKLAGYGSYGPWRARMGYRFTVEHSVYVAEEFQGQGIGRILLKALIEQATAQGLHAMIAGVDTSNAGSIAFHEKLGFEQVGTFRQVGKKHGKWLDVFFLQRMLNSSE